MNLEQLIEHFNLATDSIESLEQFRKLILDLAVRGRLSKQDDKNSNTVAELVEKIKQEKKELYQNKIIPNNKNVRLNDQIVSIFDIPKSWAWVSLDEIAVYIQRGKSPKYSDKQKIPVISQKCIQWKKFDFSKVRFIDPNTLNKYQDYRFLQLEDLLWNSTGTGTIGRVNIFAEFNGYTKIVGDSHVTIVRTSKHINSKYILYWLSSNSVQENIELIASGSTKQKELNTSTIRSFPVPLPNYNDQEIIVQKIESLFAQIDQLEQKIKQDQTIDEHLQIAVLDDLQSAKTSEESKKSWKRLTGNFEQIYRKPEHIDQLKQAILNEAVRGRLVPQDPNDEPAEKLLERIKEEKQRLYEEGKIRKPKELPAIKDEEIPYELPRTWKWCKLGEIVIVEMGQSPPGNTYNKDGIGIPLINGPVEFGLGPFSYTKIRQYTTKPSKICSKEDFLLCVRGSTTGRTNISGFDACIGRGVAALKPLYRDDFVRWCIVNLRSKIFNTGKGSTFPSINRTEILNLLIPLPPEREQEIIIKRIKETFSKCDELKEKLIQSQKTDKRLLEALVNDALKDDKSENDEPAHIIPLPNITTTDVHGGIIAKVIQAHEKNPQYQNLLGHVKAEKVSHLVESHLGIELDRNPKRLAAGPADFPHLKKVEHRAQMKRWFTRKNQKIGYSYKPGDQMAEIIKTIDEKLGSKKDQVDELIKRFLPLDKLRSEVVATLYAAWNDLIADEKTPTDDEIVQEASTKEHWSKEKEKIPKENFYKALEWMRDKKLVPDGRGKRTVKKK